MKKYWIVLKGNEDHPIVAELPEKIEGFLTTTRIYKDGTKKSIGFHSDMIVSIEEFDDELERGQTVDNLEESEEVQDREN